MTVKPEQPFKKRIHNTSLRLSRDHSGIQGLGFRSVDEDKIRTHGSWGTPRDQQQAHKRNERNKALNQKPATDDAGFHGFFIELKLDISQLLFLGINTRISEG
jgi:hypothetical protein